MINVEHDWFLHDGTGLWACRKCGIVRRADHGNKPCKGTTPIAVRAVEGKLEKDDVDAYKAKLVAWLRKGGPCMGGGGCVYGPHQDALDMVAEAIERGEDLKEHEER